MKKETLVAQLEAAKSVTSVVDIDKVVELIKSLEVPKVTTLSSELVEEISKRIESCLDHNSEDLVDKEQVTFDISYGNQLEVEDVYVDVYKIMEHITAILEEYESDEDDELDSNSNGDESGLVQSAMREFNELSNR
jgi:hypothetical protein